MENHRHDELSRNYLENELILERGKGRGTSWWSLYARLAKELAEQIDLALVVSQDVSKALIEFLPKSVWIYVANTQVDMIGHGASLRYFLSEMHSLFYVDLDVEINRQMNWLKRMQIAREDSNAGMIRTCGRTRSNEFYRGVLGSRVFIRKITEFDFSEAAFGQVLCNLAHSGPPTFLCEGPSKPTQPSFGEVWPNYCWDEYMLHTLAMPFFARKGQLHTIETHTADVTKDPRWEADKNFVEQFVGNTFSTWHR
ncbi:MAG: hypothetical protein CMO55_17100 [Verrucomicrobiales bacterium]|nr:hypothetical protein [Verrucomicrobiales bacterium]